jgi:hypothetical protein
MNLNVEVDPVAGIVWRWQKVDLNRTSLTFFSWETTTGYRALEETEENVHY